jgi:hypothetical protein
VVVVVVAAAVVLLLLVGSLAICALPTSSGGL